MTTLPALPAENSTSWYQHYAAIDAAVRHTGVTAFDSFAGSTDMAKLTAAMSYAAAQTYKPVIQLGNRAYTLTGSLGKPYDGFALRGVGWGSLNAEQGVKHTQVTINSPDAAWLSLGTSGAAPWNWKFDAINFVGSGSNTQFLSAPSSTVPLSGATFGHLTFQNFKGVLGNDTEAAYLYICSIIGYWNVLSCLDSPIYIGGSDNRTLWPLGMNLGSGTMGPVNNGGGGRYLVKLKGLSNTNIGPIYVTADNGWRGMKVNGSSQHGRGVAVTGAIIEGRNATDPCEGNLIRVEGGAIAFRDVQVDCGMTNPGPTEHGMVEILGTDSQVILDGMTFTHAAGVANTVPCVYASGQPRQVTVRIRNTQRGLRPGGVAWGAQDPVVQQTVAGLVADYDSSVAVVTGA